MAYKHNHYSAMREALTATGDTNFCSVIALAFALDISPAQAQKRLREFGRRKGKGITLPVLLLAIVEGGRSYKRLTKHRCTKAKTMITLMKSIPKRGTFLVYQTTHVAIVRDGEVMDWSEGRRKRIIAVYRIED
jgi:hypothetical protein